MRHVPSPLPLPPPPPSRRALREPSLLARLLRLGRSGGRATAAVRPARRRASPPTAGSATSVHVMWNATGTGPRSTRCIAAPRRSGKYRARQHMVDVTRLRPSTRVRLHRAGPGRRRAARAAQPGGAGEDAGGRGGRPLGADPPRRRPSGRAVGGRAVQLSWSAAHGRPGRGVVRHPPGRHEDPQRGRGPDGDRASRGCGPARRYTFTVRARDAAGNLSPASAAVRLTTPGTDDGRATAPTGFRATTHRDGRGVLPRPEPGSRRASDGEITEYQIHLDGRPATSLVYGGERPARPGDAQLLRRAEAAGVTHRVRVRARLPDGTWGGFSAERTVTTGVQGRSGVRR